MFACADLNQGTEEIADLTGIMPALGGSHPGLGTRNALLSLGYDQYLEIIAPDPEQNLTGTVGQLLSAHGGSGVRGWAVATDNLEAIETLARAAGYGCNDIIDMDRTTPEGVYLAWQVRLLTGDSLLPFFIDWKNSPHPAENTPQGCTLLDFCVRTDDPESMQQFADSIDLKTKMIRGERELTCVLASPKGELKLNPW